MESCGTSNVCTAWQIASIVAVGLGSLAQSTIWAAATAYPPPNDAFHIANAFTSRVEYAAARYRRCQSPVRTSEPSPPLHEARKSTNENAATANPMTFQSFTLANSGIPHAHRGAIRRKMEPTPALIPWNFPETVSTDPAESSEKMPATMPAPTPNATMARRYSPCRHVHA